MVGTISRRDCLKFALATWLGSMFVGPVFPKWPVPVVSDYAVPIEGLGLGIRFTNLLRVHEITTIGKLLEVLNRNGDVVASPLYSPDEAVGILHFDPALKEIRARLAAYARSGPVPFALLTRLETEVLNLVVRGHPDRKIAMKLGISSRAVSGLLDSTYQKLQGLCAHYPLEAEPIRR